MQPHNRESSKELTFEDFKKLAGNDALSRVERVGFPNSYRQGKEDLIFRDITHKLTNLNREKQTIVDIGPGCSGPALALIEWCRERGHRLALVDSSEMLQQLPDEPFIDKNAGQFPSECNRLLECYSSRVDAVICYSVLHYIFNETNLFDFLDASLQLLAEGGQMLIGDVPNVSKRRRFFSSAAGKAFHRDFTKTDTDPEVVFNQVTRGKIDDSVLLGLVARARSAGCDAYLLPQPADLPMANRREDLLICKP